MPNLSGHPVRVIQFNVLFQETEGPGSGQMVTIGVVIEGDVAKIVHVSGDLDQFDIRRQVFTDMAELLAIEGYFPRVIAWEPLQ